MVDLLLRAYGDYARGDGTVYAAAVTYYVLLSFFPFMIFLVSMFGIFVQDPTVQERVVNEIVGQLPPSANLDAQIESVISGVAGSNTTLLGLVGIAGAAWTSTAVFAALRRALNRAYNVPEARSFLHGRIRDIASIFIVILLLTLSTVLTATMVVIQSTAREWFGEALGSLVWWSVRVFVPLTVSFIVFLLIYRWIPNHMLTIRELWIGTLIAAVGFEAGKHLFAFYVTNFGRFDEVYGALGGAMAILFFVFMMANLIIIAADLNSELAKDRRVRAR